MTDYAVSKEVAEQQLNELFDYYCVIIDEDESVDRDEKQMVRAIKSAKKSLIKYIQLGLVEIIFQDDTCIVKQHLRKSIGEKTEIIYKELTPLARIAMSKADESDFTSQSYYLLGALSGWGYQGMLKLKIQDAKVAENLSAIFLLLYGQ